MKMKLSALAAVLATGMFSAAGLGATQVVSSIAPNDLTPGVWGVSDSGGSGTSSIVANAPAGDPLGPGSGLITTTNSNADKAETGVSNNYGIVSSIINSINLAYSYYKASSGVTADAAAAPSIKLSFYNPSYVGDNFVTLIYEPYYNTVGNPVPDVWHTDSINANTGLFWENGGFGQGNQGGGTYATNKTLNDWVTAFDSTSGGAFSNAVMTEVRIGMGTYNPGQTGYFDDVVVNGTAQADTTYNFEPAAAVPLPKAAYAGLGLIAGLGLLGAAKRRRRMTV